MTPDRRQILMSLAALGGLKFVPTRLRAEQEEVVFDEANMLPGDFTWHPEREPEGAVAVVVSIPEQRVHVYRNGIRIAVSTCSTGREGHATPTGVFTVLQKDADHRSSTYNNAAMPNMNRLTWDGIALHAGNLPGYPASHGCVRLPLEFSALLFEVTHIGTPVIISGARNDPWELVHPGFVLSGFAETEMEEAVSGLEARQHPSDWTGGQSYPVTSVLATAADRKIVLMENGRKVTEGANRPRRRPGAGRARPGRSGRARGRAALDGDHAPPRPGPPSLAGRAGAEPAQHPVGLRARDERAAASGAGAGRVGPRRNAGPPVGHGLRDHDR
jgi:hypothetical protein